MDRRQLLKALAAMPIVAALPLVAAKSVATSPDAIHKVCLAGEGGWLDDVDIRETLMGVLTACEPYGIVEGRIRITTGRWGRDARGVTEATEDDSLFLHFLPTTADRAACDFVNTSWLVHRERLIENVPKCVLSSMEINVQVRDAVKRPYPAMRFVRRQRPDTATATLQHEGSILHGKV